MRSHQNTKKLTEAEKVIAFIESYCHVPEGILRGKKVKLLKFQKDFITAIYDNPAGTSRAYLSIARKNAKTATISMIVLAHLVGPKAFQNSRIISGARTRKQAAEVYNYAAKMVAMSPELRAIIKAIPSQKILVGLPMNVEYQALSADAKGAHGGSPILAVLDEVGQVRGPYDAFFEAIETSQGAYEGKSLLIAISTQASSDGDLFSTWIDDAKNSKDPHIVSHVYTAPSECDLFDREAWKAANPALGVFRSLSDVEEAAERAARLPSSENSFRWLFLNQRIEMESPFLPKSAWEKCAAIFPRLGDGPVFGGLDLSEVHDLTALVLIERVGSNWYIHPEFWLPKEGLREKSRLDMVPYDVWSSQGYLNVIEGKTIDYEFIAHRLAEVLDKYDVRKIAFDRWNFKHLKPALVRAGIDERVIENKFEEFGQGFQSMSPALRELETLVFNKRIFHNNNPVMNMCADAAVVKRDPAGNRKLDKSKSTRRIDGMVALAMAAGVSASFSEAPKREYQMMFV